MRIGIAAVLFIMAVACGDICSAQGVQTSSIVGTVRDSSGAIVPHAAVELAGTQLVGGNITTSSDASGVYRFTALPPGPYRVAARQPGFADAIRADIELLVGTTFTVDLSLSPAEVAVGVSVRNVSPLIDVSAATSSTRINKRLLENLPLKRDFNDLINLAPGVAMGVGFGGTQGSNAVYVDGVDTTEPQLGNSYLRFNQNWLQEVEVVGLGAGPEYTETTGVSANAVFRSGSNAPSGLFETLTTRPSWLARNTRSLSQQLQRNFAPLELLQWWDTSAQMGGPILRDTLWYFAGFESYVYEKKPAGYSGPGTQTLSDNRTLLKITASAGRAGRLEGFVQQGFYNSGSEELSLTTPEEATYDAKQPQTTAQARFTWTARDKTLLEIRSGGFRSDGHWDPQPPATREGPPPRFDIATQTRSDNAWTWADFNRTRYTTTATVSHYIDGRWGRHEIRGAVEYERSWMQTVQGWAGGMTFTDDNGLPIRVALWDGETTEASASRVGGYVADTWRAGRFTFSPGLRIDVNRSSIPHTRDVYSSSPLAPIFGVAWDVLDSHRLALRAHAGRSFDPVILGRISTTDLSDRGGRTTYDITPTGELVLRSSSPPATTSNTSVSSHVKPAHVDQFSGGAEWQILNDVAVEATVIYRRFGNFIGMFETGRRWTPVQRQDPGPDNILGTTDDGDFLTVYALEPSDPIAFVYGNVADSAERRYRALQLIGRKRFSDGWQAQVSYTWPRTYGSVSNEGGTNSGLNDLGTGGAYANPNRAVNNTGISAFDPKEFKALGELSLPQLGGFTVGAVYRYTTGRTWARRATIRNLGTFTSDSILVEQRGSRRLPAINNVDVRVEKLIPVNNALRVGVAADIFNVTNQGVHNSSSGFPAPIIADSGPNFGVPGAWVDPRLLRIGVRLLF